MLKTGRSFAQADRKTATGITQPAVPLGRELPDDGGAQVVHEDTFFAGE